MHKKQKKDWLQHLQKVPYFPKRPQACPEQKPEHPSLPDYSKAFSFHFQCRIRSKCDEKKKPATIKHARLTGDLCDKTLSP